MSCSSSPYPAAPPGGGRSSPGWTRWCSGRGWATPGIGRDTSWTRPAGSPIWNRKCLPGEWKEPARRARLGLWKPAPRPDRPEGQIFSGRFMIPSFFYARMQGHSAKLVPLGRLMNIGCPYYAWLFKGFGWYDISLLVAMKAVCWVPPLASWMKLDP